MNKTVIRPWGYANIEDDVIYIPVISGNLAEILAELHDYTGITKMVFTAVINPDDLKSHLHHITMEWRKWVPEVQDWSHCIEIEYQPQLKI